MLKIVTHRVMVNKLLVIISAFLLTIAFCITGQAANNTYVFDLTGNSYSSGTSFNVADNANNDLDVSSSWTFECWLYVDSRTASTYPAIMDRRTVFSMYLIDGATGGDYAVRFVARDGSDNIIASVRCDDNGSSPQVMSFDTWYHVAVTRDGTTARLFINGNLADSSTDSDFSLTAATSRINIGARYWGGYERFLDGALDEVRVSKVARYTSSFSINTGSDPLGDDSNTLLLFHFDDNSSSDLVPNNYASNYAFSVYGHNCAWPTNYTAWDGLSDDLPLPVLLSSFRAIAGNGKVTLRWVTESEINNRGFEVYRSDTKDGVYQLLSGFATNPELLGKGNTTVKSEYSYTDNLVQAGNTYWYKLADVDFNGERTFHGPVSAILLSSDNPFISYSGNVPKKFKLYPNFPNPFNPETSLKFDVPVFSNGPAKAELKIFNSLGELVKVVFDAPIAAGTFQTVWDGTDSRGISMPSGVYFAVLTANYYSQSIKMVLMR